MRFTPNAKHFEEHSTLQRVVSQFDVLICLYQENGFPKDAEHASAGLQFHTELDIDQNERNHR